MSFEILDLTFINDGANSSRVNVPLLNAIITSVNLNNSNLDTSSYNYDINGINFNLNLGINRVKIMWNSSSIENDNDDVVTLGNEYGWINPKFLIIVNQWHNNTNNPNNYSIKSFDYAFYDCVKLISVPTSIPNNAISFNSMFENAISFNQYIGDWDISTVSGFSGMFKGASSFNKPLTNWDTNNAISFNSMFENASSFNQNISNFVTTNVIDMSYMFANAISFNQSIGNWDTSNVEYMSNMFQNAISFNQDISNWIIDEVKDFSDFLSNSGLDIKNYNSLLINWLNSNSEPELTMGAKGLYYSGIDAYNAHNTLTDDSGGYYWTIEGDTYIPPASVCFCKGTLINTDKGIIEIDKINPNYITINNKKIIAVTKTIQQKKSYLVCFEKDSICLNYPNKKTIMSKEHKIYYKGKMIEAYKFSLKFKNVYMVEYNKEILYNILMEHHRTVLANNLICETLHPNNLVAKLYNMKTTKNEKNNIVYNLEKFKFNKKKEIRKEEIINYNQLELRKLFFS